MKILLLDEGQPQSLYLSRKLQECTDIDADIQVAIATSSVRRQKLANYFPLQCFAVTRPDDPDYAAQIAALAASFDVIIPISNNCLPIACNPATSWAEKVFPQISPDIFATVFDKYASTELARSLGIRCPDTVLIDNRDALAGAIDTLGLPIVLKQRIGWAGAGVRICHSLHELQQAFDDLQQQTHHSQNRNGLFCQRYISGTPALAGGLFLHGRALRLHAADHTFSYPPLTGSSKSIISRNDRDMQNALQQFCAAIQWNGLGNIDFIRSENGELYFLEMNPRIWGSIAAAEDAGVEMIRPLLQVLRGEVPDSALAVNTNVHSALFPQYLLTLCQQGGYGNLWRAISERWLWRQAPWHNPRYMFGYLVKFTHAWLHGLKRTIRHTPPEPDDEQST